MNKKNGESENARGWLGQFRLATRIVGAKLPPTTTRLACGAARQSGKVLLRLSYREPFNPPVVSFRRHATDGNSERVSIYVDRNIAALWWIFLTGNFDFRRFMENNLLPVRVSRSSTGNVSLPVRKSHYRAGMPYLRCGFTSGRKMRSPDQK